MSLFTMIRDMSNLETFLNGLRNHDKNMEKAITEKARKQIAQYGEGEFYPAPEWKNPGEYELRASVRTFKPEWRTIDFDRHVKKLRIVTGHRPADLTDEELKDIKGCLGDKLTESHVPVEWLARRMRIMCCTEEFLAKLIGEQTREAAIRSAFMSWVKAVQFHNGFVKTLQEMVKFVTPEQEARWRAQDSDETDDDNDEEEKEEEEEEEEDKDDEPKSKYQKTND